MLCGSWFGDRLNLALDCVAMQKMRGRILALFQDVLSMHFVVWQENMVHIAGLVQGHMRMMKAASSGDELDGWYGILVLFLMKLTAAGCRSGMCALHMCRQKVILPI